MYTYICICIILLYIIAVEQMKQIEKQSFANLHILGSKISDCSQTALYRLTNGADGDVAYSTGKYRL